MPTYPIRTVALLSLSLFCSQGWANDNSPLQPYTALYTLDWASGVSFSGDAVRTLEQQGDRWVLKTEASALFASLKESSQFTLPSAQNGQDHIRPYHYSFLRKIFGKKRQAKLDFNWPRQQVTNNVNEKPWQMDIHPGVLDKLSVQLQLRLDLQAGKTRFNYQVADGGRLKNYRFTLLGKESVTTPAGTFEAVKVERDRGENSERKTWIWFAPKQDYMIVKIHQTEKNSKEYKLSLKKFNYL